MSSPRNPRERLHELLRQDLKELNLHSIAENYQEVLDEAARKNTPMLEVLASLIAGEVRARRQRALERRIGLAKLPPRKTLEAFDFTFPKRIPKQKVLRLLDCKFVTQHRCAVLIGRTGTGKSHLLNALGYTACEKGISVRWTRAIDMLNVLTTAGDQRHDGKEAPRVHLSRPASTGRTGLPADRQTRIGPDVSGGGSPL